MTDTSSGTELGEARGARAVAILVAVGVIVGLLSGMFGIGGGTVIVPALVWLGLSQRNAAATSTLAIVPTSISGVISYATGGHVDCIAALLLFCGMFVGGQIGSWLLSRLPELVLRWIFVAFLVFVVVNQAGFVPSRSQRIVMVRRVRPDRARHLAAGHVPEFDYHQCGESQAQVGACENRAHHWRDGGCDRATGHVGRRCGHAARRIDTVRLLPVRAAGAFGVRGGEGHARGAGWAGRASRLIALQHPFPCGHLPYGMGAIGTVI